MPPENVMWTVDMVFSSSSEEDNDVPDDEEQTLPALMGPPDLTTSSASPQHCNQTVHTTILTGCKYIREREEKGDYYEPLAKASQPPTTPSYN